MNRIKTALALAVCPLALSANQARAQDDSEQVDNSQSTAGEIVVTATRSSQVVSKVPISITAISGANLEKQGIKDISDVAAIAPGVSFDTGYAGSTRISIRGIDSQAGAATTGLYIDDAPIQARSIGIGQDFSNSYPQVFDLDRIEVLRGPQGTLFGAGSEGGTVRFILVQPNLTTFSANLRAEVAATEKGGMSYEAGAAIGGPIVDGVLGFRASAFYQHGGGYIDRYDPLTGVKIGTNVNKSRVVALRGAMTFAPAEGVEITPSIFYQQTKAPFNNAYWDYLSNPSDGNFATGVQIEEPVSDRFILPALAVSVDLPNMQLISNTSYFDKRALHTVNFSNFGPSILGYPISPNNFVPGAENYSGFELDENRQKNFTQELRLQSDDPSSALQWVLGVFYQRAVSTSQGDIHETSAASFDNLLNQLFGTDVVGVFGVPLLPGDLSFASRIRGVDKQIAGFADVTYKLSDRLSVSVGARYAKTEFEFSTQADGPWNGGPSTSSGKQSEKPFTPKFNISYQADPDNLFYVTAAKGFRVGGVNVPLPANCAADLATLGLTSGPDRFNSDSVWSYEIGSKNRLFNRALSVNASAFTLNWNGIQQLVNLPTCGFNYITNAGKAKSSGFDIQIDATPTKGLSLGGSFSYTDAKFTSPVLGGGAVNIVNDGTPLAIAPVTATAYLQVDKNFGSTNAYIRADYRHSGRHRALTIENDPTLGSYRGYPFVRPAVNMVNLKVGANRDGFEGSIFVNNLFNYHEGINLVQGGTSTNLIAEYVTERPRTFGVNFSYRY